MTLSNKTRLTSKAVALLLALLAFVTVGCLAALAQTVYLNFDFTGPSGSPIYLRGSLAAASPTTATGNFTGLSLPATTFFPNGSTATPLTSYGVTSAASTSGTAFGTYAEVKNKPGLYNVTSLTFKFQSYDASGNVGYYVVSGSGTGANYTLYKTASDYNIASATSSLGSLKAVATGTGSLDAAFTDTALNQAPEIDGGQAPKAALLFGCIVVLWARARIRQSKPMSQEWIAPPIAVA